MYLISLIIPIYNAEEYLDNTLKTVINQSIGFENIELILVDDNSTDDSKKIIEKYAEKHDNIVPYYSKQNHGYPGFGRNIGLKKATADYIMFMDNDDELDKDICKNLYNTITNENADVVCCDKVDVDLISEIKNNITYINGKEIDNKVLIENDNILFFGNMSVWNKIYRKKIISKNQITFLENTTSDDFVFTLTYFLKSNKLVYLKNYFGYKWNIKSDSLSHVVTKEFMDDLLNTTQINLNLLREAGKFELSKYILKPNYLIIQSSYLKVDNKEFKRVLKRIHQFENEIDFTLTLNPIWLNVINYLIMHEHYNFAIITLKIINKIRSSKNLRKINRKLK